MAVEQVTGGAGDEAGAAGLGGVQVFGRFPQVFQDMDEVDDDVDADAAGVGFGPDAVDLVVVAVDQGDPGAVVVGVAAVGLGEDLRAAATTWALPRCRQD
jgi:hypothetical protein